MFKRNKETGLWFTKKPINWDTLEEHQKSALRKREYVIVAGILIAIISVAIMISQLSSTSPVG